MGDTALYDSPRYHFHSREDYRRFVEIRGNRLIVESSLFVFAAIVMALERGPRASPTSGYYVILILCQKWEILEMYIQELYAFARALCN
jgi:hypothetical protein